MKISVEEFMRQETGAGKKSRLDPYEHEILTLMDILMSKS